jgi:hypothetical protein
MHLKQQQQDKKNSTHPEEKMKKIQNFEKFQKFQKFHFNVETRTHSISSTKVVIGRNRRK